MKDFYALFIKELRDIYDAEKQIAQVMPHIVKAVHAPNLKEALQSHLKDSKEQIKRLETIGTELNEDLSGCKNEVVKTLLNEAHKLIKANYDPIVKDAAIINIVQHIEHYEIASYGTLKAFAKHLKLTDIFNLLDDSSSEEGGANKTLTHIAEGNLFQKGINDKASEKCA